VKKIVSGLVEFAVYPTGQDVLGLRRPKSVSLIDWRVCGQAVLDRPQVSIDVKEGGGLGRR
jgi:hypothetical protein